jgi:hypothetical protein
MSHSVEALCVDPERVHEIWPHIRHFIRSAIDRVGLNAFSEIEADVLEKRSLVWIAWNGRIVSAGVTQLCNGVCTLVAYGGERHDHLITIIENYARAEGCQRMRILGRKGWSRVLKDYRQPCILLERQL